MKNIKIGADPELFLTKDSKVVSAEGIIGGTKSEPRFISKEHAVQEDNVMIEFNIPASETKKDFTYNINFVKSYLETFAETLGYGIDYSASAEFDSDELFTEQAREFGCSRDYNVYLGDYNVSPEATTNLRTCGGHIHVGWEDPKEEETIKLVKAMDLTLGLESLLLDHDDRRRTMYGKAGSFRFKPYGMEYRTLSNFWIKSDELLAWAYDTTMRAIELVTSGKIDSLSEEYSALTETAINDNDKQLAKQLLEKIKKEQLETIQ
jgi:hypothetical protein